MSATADSDPEATAVTGLAREVERLGRQIHAMRDMPKRMDVLAALVARIAETSNAKKPEPSTTPSWLDQPADPGRPAETSRAARDASELLARLAGWVGGVYLRYADARQLPECWLWHPDVVEELLWLHAAWLAAYSDEAPVSAVGDWHDRQRPGVVSRVKQYAGICSLEAHLPGGECQTPAPTAPVADAATVIGAWWAVSRDQPAPAPSEEQLAQRRTSRRRR